MLLSVKSSHSSAEMAECATYSETFSVPREVFADVNAVLASIDFGCSLIKAVLVPKEEQLDKAKDRLTLHCLTFQPSEFDAMLKALKSRVHFASGVPMRITGVGCARFNSQIEAELGCKTVFVEEFLSAARGMHFLVNNCDPAAFFHPDPPVADQNSSKAMPDVMKHIIEGMRQKCGRNNPKSGAFPAIMFLVGSGAASILIDEQGRSKMLTGISVAGRTFLGLSRLLLGTSDYKKIIALAEKGDARETAFLIRHMIEENPASPYGLHDPNIPIQPFGHVPNDDKDLESYRKEDIAAGLVHMICSLFFFFSMSSSESTGINRYYVGGNWPRAEIIRNTWCQSYSSMFPDTLHFKFAKTGHLGAVGAMLTDPADMMKYLLPPF